MGHEHESECWDDEDAGGCCDARGPCHGAVDLFEDDDGPRGPVYKWTADGTKHVYDDPDAEPGPYCPRDALEVIERCARLLFGAATGKAVPPEEAGNAARDAVRLLEMYGVDEDEWFYDALCYGAGNDPGARVSGESGGEE